MDLRFQVPMQYCCLQHRTLLPSPVTSTPVCSFCFGSVSSFFLEFFSTDLQQHTGHLSTWGVHLSVSYLFCLFILFMGFSRQEYWSGLPFPFPVDHILSEFSSMTRPSWVALHSMAHSFTELDKDVVHVIRLIFCDGGFQSVCPWWRRIRGLRKLPNGIDWLRGTV